MSCNSGWHSGVLREVLWRSLTHGQVELLSCPGVDSGRVPFDVYIHSARTRRDGSLVIRAAGRAEDINQSGDPPAS